MPRFRSREQEKEPDRAYTLAGRRDGVIRADFRACARGALLRLAGADRDLAAAISNRYPQLSLTASESVAGDSPGRMFDDWLRTLGATCWSQ